MRNLGLTSEEIDIQPLATQLLKDLKHGFANGEPVYDVTFKNVQAGLRTDFLFRAANQLCALVLGTGDLSEIMASVSKTLIQHLVRWVGGGAGTRTVRT